MATRPVNMGEYDARAFQRMLFGNAERVHCDSQGRVVLPQRLVEVVGLSKEVVVAGAGDRIEIWPPSRWEELQATRRLFYEQLAKSYFGGPAPADLPPGRPAPAIERMGEVQSGDPSAPGADRPMR